MFSGNQQNNYAIKKIDTLFYNSVQRAKGTYRNKIFCHLFKLLLLLIFHIVDSSVLGSNRSMLFPFMRFGIAVSAINMLINMIIRCVGYSDNQSNNKFLTNLSQIVGHSSPMQPLDHPEDIRKLAKCVSHNLYNASNGSLNNDPAVTSEMRKKYEKINQNLVQSQVLQNAKCLPCIDLFGRLFCLAAVIYGIVVLIACKPTPSIPEYVVLGLYIVLQSINIWAVILVLLMIIFSPFICCFGCIYLCCFGSRMFIDRNTLMIPQATPATAQLIEQSDGSCVVCLQNFTLKDKLIALKCSPKHVFHETCILNWLKVSNSCPICRTPVPQSI